MAEDEVQPQNPEGETPGKKPGEGSQPVEQDVNTSGQSLGGDTDSAATGTTPTEGGGDGTNAGTTGDTGGATGTTPTEGGGDAAGGPGTEGGGP